MTRILVIGPSWVGDMVMAQSLFMALKADESDCEIHVAAPTAALPITMRMPEVKTGWPLDARSGRIDISARYRLARSLKNENFDLAIILPNSIKSAIVPLLAGIKQRRGYKGEARHLFVNQMHHLDKNLLPLTVERFVALAQARPSSHRPEYAHPKLDADQLSAKQYVKRNGLSLARPIIGLCPGAEYGPAKQWPLEKFQALAEQISGQNHQVWIFGGPKDVASGDRIANGLDPDRVKNLCGKTSLLEAVDLMSLTSSVASNDSGLMHVAAALQLPLVALFGSSSPAMTPPLSEDAKILETELDCRPCFKRTCPLGHLDCLNLISVDRVAQALQI